MAARAHEAGEDYFAVIVDEKMPDMAGVQTAAKIREAAGGTACLIAGYDWSEIEAEANVAGVTGFIRKPFFKSTLHGALSQLAGGASPEGQLGEDAFPSLDGMRVLLAEDQPVNVEITMLILEKAGALVTHAEDGLVARKLFSKSEPGYFEAILMDLHMPHMDGFEATDAIRAMNRADARTVPIIALTRTPLPRTPSAALRPA